RHENMAVVALAHQHLRLGTAAVEQDQGGCVPWRTVWKVGLRIGGEPLHQIAHRFGLPWNLPLLVPLPLFLLLSPALRLSLRRSLPLDLSLCLDLAANARPREGMSPS